MLPHHKLVLTSSLSRPSRLGDGLVSSDNDVGFIRSGSSPNVTQQGEEVVLTDSEYID
jgi:hypothetical protein